LQKPKVTRSNPTKRHYDPISARQWQGKTSRQYAIGATTAPIGYECPGSLRDAL